MGSLSPDPDSPLVILRERLQSLGVDIDFWQRHEDRLHEWDSLLDPLREDMDDQKWSQVKQRMKERMSLVAYQNDDVDVRQSKEEGREAASRIAADIADMIAHGEAVASEQSLHELKEAAPEKEQLWRCALLLMTGNRLTELSSAEQALEAYGQAVDLAPSPQAQMEVGYVLARRGTARFPAPGYLGDWEDPLLLVPDKWSSFESGFEGLDHYEFIYPELLSGPEFPEQPRVLRLALEAYGRVYCHYLARVDGLAEGKYPDEEEGWLQMLVIDGLHSLLAQLTQDDRDLLDLCFRSFFLWAGTAGLVEPREIERRFRTRETYHEGREEGRKMAEAVQAAVEITRRTVVIADPDTFAENVANEVAAKLGQPAPDAGSRTEAGLATQLGPAWAALPPAIRDMLMHAELCGPNVKLEAARVGVALLYANVTEAAVRHAVGAERMMLGEAIRAIENGRMPVRRTCDRAALLDTLKGIQRLRNRVGHGDPRRWDPPSEEELRHIHQSIMGDISVLRTIMECVGH